MLRNIRTGQTRHRQEIDSMKLVTLFKGVENEAHWLGQRAPGKGRPESAPVGPSSVSADEILDRLRKRGYVE